MKFNGFSNIEIEMMKDEIKKVMPAVLSIAEPFSKVVKANYDGLIKQGFNEKQAMYMAVQAASKQMGFN